MQMNHAVFARSTALRVSLKRGLARQAIAMAEQAGTDLPGLFHMAAGLRPNAKAVERLALRLKAQPGVTRVALAPGGRALSVTMRAVRALEARLDGAALFQETGLIYLRASERMSGRGVVMDLCAVTFNAHALERLVERSDVDLRLALLPQVDAEAQAIFRGWRRATGFDDGGDEYQRAALPGLWAGGQDEMALDPDWGLCGPGRLPVYSARTFLSEAEMRPTVWLRWRDDPACRMG